MNQGDDVNTCTYNLLEGDGSTKELCSVNQCQICDPNLFLFAGFNLYSCEEITKSNSCGHTMLLDRTTFYELVTPPEDPAFAKTCAIVQDTVEPVGDARAFCYCDTTPPTGYPRKVTCYVYYGTGVGISIVHYLLDDKANINRAIFGIGNNASGSLRYINGELVTQVKDNSSNAILCTGKVIESSTSPKLVGLDYTDCNISPPIQRVIIPEVIYKFSQPSRFLREGSSMTNDEPIPGLIST
jgi:hypothetical protein